MKRFRVLFVAPLLGLGVIVGCQFSQLGIDTTCRSDVSVQITAVLAAAPSGSTFTSPPGACYLVKEGIVVKQPVTINGGIFRNKLSGREGGLQPIIKVLSTHDVTLENLTVQGRHVHGFQAELVGEAGINVQSSANIDIVNVTANDTFGDGLEFVGAPKTRGTPDSHIYVNNFTSTNAGRNGITPADITDSLFVNVRLSGSATRSIDFEGGAAGGVTFLGGGLDHGINVVEPLSGAISFDFLNTFGRLFVSQNTAQRVTYTGGSLTCERRAPVSCIRDNGVALTLSHSYLDYRPGLERVTELAYAATTGANLTLDDTPLVGAPNPPGTVDSTSRVTVK